VAARALGSRVHTEDELLSEGEEDGEGRGGRGVIVVVGGQGGEVEQWGEGVGVAEAGTTEHLILRLHRHECVAGGGVLGRLRLVDELLGAGEVRLKHGTEAGRLGHLDLDGERPSATDHHL
jgi:hypothetical protein